MGLTILGAVLGAVVAAIVTIIVESLRRPCLKLMIADTFERDYSDKPAKSIRALRVKLRNLPPPRWAGWISRNPALQCTGHITFHHLDGQDIFGRAMTVRWSDCPEPIPMTFELDGKEGRIQDPARMCLEQRRDVCAGTNAVIDVAARFDNEEDCFGWSNESYFSDPPWRNPKWKLSKGRYLVRVTMISSGQTFTALFRLVNDVDRNDFRLENALPRDLSAIEEAVG